MVKKFYIQQGIGHAKYVVNFHNGRKKHEDGSAFYDIRIFKNKKDLQKFENKLLKLGYSGRK
jgi:hypothetical protein